MPDSTLSAKPRKAIKQKPNRPNNCPLFAHASGQWAKKIDGKIRYFGVWADLPAAMDDYHAFLNGWENQDPAAYTIRKMCNDFLHAKKESIKGRTWDEYQDVCKIMVSVWGPNKPAASLKPDHFKPLRDKLATKKNGEPAAPKTLQNLIGRCRAVLNFAYKNAKVDLEIRGGQHFAKPSVSEIRKYKASQDHLGELDLQANQINDVLELATPQIRAMILLGVNVGMGNEDCAKLELRHVNMASGWLNYPRPKTGVKRLAKLWPETIEAIQMVLDARNEPKSKGLAPFVFITKYGGSWFKESRANPLSAEFRKLLKKTGHHINGLGFYSLRRTFETVAGEIKDQAAVDLSMGHEGPDMATLYRQRVQHHRLEAVAKHVRHWLFELENSK